MGKFITATAITLIILVLVAAAPETAGLQNRKDDPVILTGKDFPALAATPLPRLGLFRYDGSFQAIPFQVDEITRAGGYAFNQGPVTAKDEDAGLDGNDEVVFMAFDAGPQAPAGSRPPGAGAGAEIEIIDPVTNGRAYAYLFAFTGDAPRSDADYVSYTVDPARGIRTQGLTYISESPMNSIYYTYQSVRQNDGSWSPDLADRLKIRGEISALIGIVDIDYQFDDLVKSRVTGWIDGPVRVVRRGEGYLKIGTVDIQGAGNSIGYNYPTYFIYPMMIDMPVNLRTYLTGITIHGASDFTRAAFGAHYYDAANPYNDNIVFDGKMSPEEQNMKLDHDHVWLAIKHPQWASVHRLFFPPEWGFIGKHVYYRDDAEAVDPPEDEPGVFAIGYEFKNFIQVSKGPVTYYMHFYFPADFKVGDEQRILDVVDRPIKASGVSISRL